MTVWVVIIEWNRPPAEVTGDPGLVGVFGSQASAETAAAAERQRFDEEGQSVYQFTKDAAEEDWTIDVHVREAEVQP